LAVPTKAARLLAEARSGPDPEGALPRIERYLAACGDLEACVPDAHAEALLVDLLSQSDWASQRLIRDPPSLAALARDPFLTREKSPDMMREELARELDARTGAGADDVGRALRRFRNHEYLRLTARELGRGRPEEVARELAHIADVCLEAAVAYHRAALETKHGAMRTKTGTRCRFVVMGMGKHGGEELNFSSDVDLIYLYESDSGSAGPDAPTLHELFCRLAERVTRTVAEVTDDGFCFRVDLRLRPEGQKGPLTNSMGAAERYYEAWGRPWERQAWIKARPVAGDRSLGDEALVMLEPFVWPRSGGPEAIAQVRGLMSRIRVELGDPDDIKVGPGGIREVEFFVQALQMVHGRTRTLRERGTLRALDKLLFAGLISEREHRSLVEGYVFLRQVEHRLQLEALRQTHALPADPERRALLARRLGFADTAAFEIALAIHRREISDIYATLGAADEPPPSPVMTLLDPATTREGLEAALSELGFASPAESAEAMEHLRKRAQSPFAPQKEGAPARIAPMLLEEVAASPDPDLALLRLVDLVGRRGGAAGIWRLIDMHRPLLRLLMSLFGTSEFLAKEFIAHPELLEPLLSARQAQPVRERADLEAQVRAALEALALDDEEARLNTLRRIKREEVLRIGLYDVAGELSPMQVSSQLSDLADVCLQAALEVVQPAVWRKYGTPAATLVVVGLGKLGGREMTYSSDLDVVFVYSDEGQCVGGREASHFEVFSRVAQRLISALSTYLDEGRLYEIDTRLRPSGQKGALVSSLEGFRAYHAGEAQLWERQALIKARTVAGDRELGDTIEELAAEHVYGAGGDAADMAREIGRLRARMEKELAQETAHRFNIKTGRGGLVDVEFLVQYLQLREGPSHPALHVRATTTALAALESEGLLPPDTARELTASYAFLRRLENRLRIVHDRSIQQITADERELDKLARRTGYHGERPGARLLADYREHTARIRAIYAQFLPVAE
jgi:[glutamine synthetase] adenylyltransferase / [glutamine synthetase]-adenylyl-L-tyrosine phosphorylase